jgi:tetratricopeptide (TPR) repeat protein
MACDLLEKLLTIADGMEDPRDKVARYVNIAGDFARAGSVERSRAVFAQADACLRQLDDRGFEASMAQEMGRVLREMGDSAGANKLLVHFYSRAAGIPKVLEKASAFVTIAHALVEAGERRWAHMVLQRAIGNIALFENESDQADELQYAAYLATRADKPHVLLRRITAFVNDFKDHDSKASLLIDIADSLASVGSRGRAHTVLRRAFQVSRMIESCFARAKIVRNIAMCLEEMGNHVEARSMWLYAFGIAVSVPAADKGPEWMEEIPSYFAGAGRFTEAIAVACALPGIVSYHRGGSSVSYPVNRSKALDTLLRIAEDLAMPCWKRNGERRMKKAFNPEEKRMATVIAHVVRGAARHEARAGLGSGRG